MILHLWSCLDDFHFSLYYLFAIRVVNGKLLHLARDVVDPNADGGESNAHDKEKGQHALGSVDGLHGRQPLLLEGTPCQMQSKKWG